MKNSPFYSTTDKGHVKSMFNNIASTYDKINRILSFGIDTIWRKALIHSILTKPHEVIVDLATGTGDQLFALADHLPQLRTIYGYDISEDMLSIAKVKAKKCTQSISIHFKQANAESIPLKDNTVDVITISFGIRNMENIQTVFKEALRILKPGGSLVILEFSKPKNKMIRCLNSFYQRKYVPFIGKLFSKDPAAYDYLHQTIDEFPFGKDFIKLLQLAGFSHSSFKALTFGITSLYKAIK